jgi:hypothetical protein
MMIQCDRMLKYDITTELLFNARIIRKTYITVRAK